VNKEKSSKQKKKRVMDGKRRDAPAPAQVHLNVRTFVKRSIEGIIMRFTAYSVFQISGHGMLKSHRCSQQS
jgi:hypothetical protein